MHAWWRDVVMFLWVYVYVYDITVRGEGIWKLEGEIRRGVAG
jgi:hypothetical protein